MEEYVGKYVRVKQEIKDGDEWIEIDWDGWTAKVIGTVMKMADGDEYEMGGEEVRNTVVSLPKVAREAPWEAHPDRWVKTESGYEPTLVPKVPLAECYRCSLNQSPIADSPHRAEPADVLFIGEAPGEIEISQQDFMVGRSGQLLRNLISQILPKYTYTINNACMCYGETPDAGAIEACNKRLKAEIEAVNPELIVPVGAVALKAVVGLSGITDYQGLLLKRDGVSFIPCFHPAAILRRADLFPDLVNALSKAKLFLDGEGLIDIPPSTFELKVAQEGSVRELLARLSSFPRLYADTETTGYNPYTDDIICLSLAGGDETGIKLGVTFPWDVLDDKVFRYSWRLALDEEVLSGVKELLEGRKIGYYNGPFDCQFLRSKGISAVIGGDVMLKQYTLDERSTAQGLKYVARRYCNAPNWEEPLKKYLLSKATSFVVVPEDVLFTYAALDACYTGTLDPLLSKLMDEHNWRLYNRILLPVANLLMEASRVGLDIDMVKLEELRKEYREKIDIMTKELIELAGREFNPGSVKQYREVLKEKLGYDGSTAKENLEHLMFYPLVSKQVELRSTKKLYASYMENIAVELVEGKIHPNLRVNGTVTGRLSSKENQYV